MSTLRLKSLDSDPLPSIRTVAPPTRTLIIHKSSHSPRNSAPRAGYLSPLHLTHKTLTDNEFNGLSIGLINLRPRDNEIFQTPKANFSSTTQNFNFLSKHYNFQENKRLTNKLDFSKIKKQAWVNDNSKEKYVVVSKAKRFAGRSPQKMSLTKEIIPVTRSRLESRLTERMNVRLNVNGVMKSFSPRTPGGNLEGIIWSFK